MYRRYQGRVPLYMDHSRVRTQQQDSCLLLYIRRNTRTAVLQPMLYRHHTGCVHGSTWHEGSKIQFCGIVQPHWRLPKNTRLTTGTQSSAGIRAGSHCVHVTDVTWVTENDQVHVISHSWRIKAVMLSIGFPIPHSWIRSGTSGSVRRFLTF